jgi:hypothetical protein
MAPRAQNRKHETMPSRVADKLMSLFASSVTKAFVGDDHRLQEVCLVIGGKPQEMA